MISDALDRQGRRCSPDPLWPALKKLATRLTPMHGSGENHRMPIRGGGKQKKSQFDPAHRQRKGATAIQERKKKRQERKAERQGNRTS